METFRPHRALVLLACSSMAWTGADAQSQGTSTTRTTSKRIEALQKQLTDQGREIEALRKQASDQDARFRELQDRLITQEARDNLPAPGSRPQPPAPGMPNRIP